MSMIGNLVRLSTAELAALRADPENYVETVYGLDESGSNRFLDVDKTWQGIDRALRSLDPPYELFGDGEILIDADWGYGPPFVHDPEAVATLVNTVRGRTAADLLGADAVELISGAYPFEETALEEDVDYVQGHFAALLSFLRSAAAEHQGVVTWVS